VQCWPLPCQVAVAEHCCDTRASVAAASVAAVPGPLAPDSDSEVREMCYIKVRARE
jgi:hypothetical protein